MAKEPRKPESGSLEKPRPSLRERLERSKSRPEMESASEARRASIDTTLERMKAESNSPGRESKQSLIRYPTEEMRERIARLAAANGRSINAEIIDRLQKSMIGDAIATLEETVGELYNRVEELEAKIREHDDQLNNRDDPSNQD